MSLRDNSLFGVNWRYASTLAGILISTSMLMLGTLVRTQELPLALFVMVLIAHPLCMALGVRLLVYSIRVGRH